MVDADKSVEWRVVQDFPEYEVSEYGTVRRVHAHHRFPNRWPAGYILKQTLSNIRIRDGQKEGYFFVFLPIKNTKSGARHKHKAIHQLVCESFHGPRPSQSHEVAHGDCIKSNNHYSNLRWATVHENRQDSIRCGTTTRGEKNPSAKLTESQILQIRELSNKGNTNLAIGKMFGIKSQTVSRIKNFRRWGYLQMDNGTLTGNTTTAGPAVAAVAQ